MAIDIQLGELSHIIQLAIAPVFLLTGVGTKLGVLANRLGRIIDRTRILEERVRSTKGADHDHEYVELTALFRRAHLINRAITLSTSCGLLICIVIASLFIGDALDLGLAKIIAVCFVVAMFSFIGSFICLLREVFIATQSLSMRNLRAMKESERPR